MHLPTLTRTATPIRPQQFSNLGQRQPAELRLLDKSQPFDDNCRVQAESAGRSPCRRDHPEAFVVPQRVGLEAGARGEFTDRERGFLRHPVVPQRAQEAKLAAALPRLA
jgi:hypothetical protein